MKTRPLLALLLLLFLSSSCKKEITDFFAFVNSRGYKFENPLSDKKTAVDESLLGGYIYKSLPVIISKKDALTYKITFLTTDLNREDRVIEAHMTKFGNETFLNLNMGGHYNVVRVNLMYNQEFAMSLVKGSLKSDLDEKAMKGLLKKSPEKDEYTPKNMVPGSTESLYYSVSFNKITVESALEKQATILYNKKTKLFKECYSYRRYEELTAKYDLPELFFYAEQNLFNNCKSIDDYKEFIANFPNSKLLLEAQVQIARIREEERMKEMIEKDKVSYHYALNQNTIEAFETFLEERKTKVYADSAKIQIENLAQNITQKDIEWKWTSGEIQGALQYIYYRIDYCDTLDDAAWLAKNLAFYSITKGTKEDKEKSLNYLGQLVHQDLSADEFLDLYIDKGFLLWTSEEYDLAIENFKIRIDKTYTDGRSFKKEIKVRYKWYLNQELVFPEQKTTWKRIKKLK